MIKFMLAGRHKRDDTQARYFYEWGNIHVALMLVNPVVYTLFKRYVQHYAVSGVTAEMLPLPFSPMGWDNFADHWLDNDADMLQALIHPDYVIRMQPHKFGDSAFHVLLMTGRTVFQRSDFMSGGGVKLVLFGSSPEGRSDEATAAAWRDAVHVPLQSSPAGGFLRKLVHSVPRGVDSEMFQGTLFARGGLNEFAFVDELWFDGLEELERLQADPAIASVFDRGRRELDGARSFGMVVTERVIADFVTEGERTPLPAVLTPGTLEARVAAQGGENWHVPKPANRRPMNPA